MMNGLLKTTLLVTLAVGSTAVWAQQDATSKTSQDPSATAPDNTKTNQRDKNQAEPTAQSQKENKSDREIARAIRRALVKDKSLSAYAHNIKVIVQDGMVTLKGPVRTPEDKQAAEAKAAEVVGSPDKVKSELDVTGKQASGKPSPSHSSNQ